MLPCFTRMYTRNYPHKSVLSRTLFSAQALLRKQLVMLDRSEHDSSRPQDIHDLYERIEAALAGHVPTSDDPLVRAVQEQWRPLTDRMSSAWLHRFTRHLALHGQAMAWEAVLRAERRTPSLATFMDLRLWSNGMFMWDLIETVHPREVPAELTRSLAWRYLTTASNQITAWRNDIVSLPSEMASGNHDNYVLVLAQALGCDRDVAVALVEQQIAQRIDDLPGYEHALRAQARGLSAEQAQAMTDTMTTLRTMVAAHARWVMESVRYSASHHRAA